MNRVEKHYSQENHKKITQWYQTSNKINLLTRCHQIQSNSKISNLERLNPDKLCQQQENQRQHTKKSIKNQLICLPLS